MDLPTYWTDWRLPNTQAAKPKMARLCSLPAEIHLEIIFHVATFGIRNLNALLQSSSAFAGVCRQYRPSILEAAIKTVPCQTFARAALQALCSDGNMSLDVSVAQGNELDSWIVPDPRHVIWSAEYTGSTVDAVQQLAYLHAEVESFMDVVIQGRTRRHTDDNPDPLWKPMFDRLGRPKVIEGVWLQEMIRFRTYHREGGDIFTWHARWYERHYGVNWEALSEDVHIRRRMAADATAAKREESQVYLRYLQKVQEVHPDARSNGRLIQLNCRHDYEYPIAERWTWAATEEGIDAALETDCDMVYHSNNAPGDHGYERWESSIFTDRPVPREDRFRRLRRVYNIRPLRGDY